MIKNVQLIFLKVFKIRKNFDFQPYIFLDNFNNPSNNVTGKKYLLKKITIQDYTKEKALPKAINFVHNNYPQLKGKINFL